MVVFIYEYGAAKPGTVKRPVSACARQVVDGMEFDRALYTLYESLRVMGYFPIVTPCKNGIRVTYSGKR
jgi:hypothetical protein